VTKPARSDAAMRLSLVPDRDLVADGCSTVAEACAFLSVSRATLFRRMAHDLPYTTVGGRRLIPKRALEEYAASGLVRRDRVS